MKPLRITLFVIAFVLLASQTFRHAYVRWIETRTSVLDKYDSETGKKISSARSLSELEAAYDAAYKEKKKEEEATKKEQEANPDRDRPVRNSQIEAQSKESDLRMAIHEWESQTKEIRELHHFWTVGVIALVLGLLVYSRVERWSGFALVILAFCEMVWATCPGFRNLAGAQPEFDRLLLHKFVFSLLSFVLLIGTWVVLRRLEARREAVEMLRS
jgi:hypothetical protein